MSSTEGYWPVAKKCIKRFNKHAHVLERLLSCEDIKIDLKDNENKTILHHFVGTQLSLMSHFADYISANNNAALPEDPQLILNLLASQKRAKTIMQKLFDSPQARTLNNLIDKQHNPPPIRLRIWRLLQYRGTFKTPSKH